MAVEEREMANRVELEALRFERIIRHYPVDRPTTPPLIGSLFSPHLLVVLSSCLMR